MLKLFFALMAPESLLMSNHLSGSLLISYLPRSIKLKRGIL